MHTKVNPAFGPMLWDYEEAFSSTSPPDIRLFVARCPEQFSPAELLAELLAVEFAHQPWSPQQLRARLDSLSDIALATPHLDRLLHAIYVNRVAEGERLTLASFDSFDAAPERLRLQLDGEPFYLGEVLLNRYRINERLGAGSFGAVYMADEVTGSRVVAIKAALSSTRAAQSSRTRKVLENEAALGTRLSHPNIVSAREFGVAENGHAFIVMDYVAGDSLRSVLRAEQLCPATAARIAIQIADAIGAAYEARVTHRDLKPENVIVTGDGGVRVTDFGLAIGQEAQWWRDGEWAGTYAYMAPELLLGKTPELDVRADIWSLGIILYEMLTGHTPTQVASREEALVAAIGGAGRTLTFPPSFPDSLRGICERCLAYDPNMRYRTAMDLVEDLRNFLSNPDASSLPPGAPAPSLGHGDGIVAWRLGVKLGAAQREHAQSQAILHAVLDHSGTSHTLAPERMNPFLQAVAHEVAASQAIQECLAICSQINCRPGLVDHSAEFISFLYRRKVPTQEQLNHLVALSAQVQSSLEQSFISVAKMLEQVSGRFAALFKSGAYLSMCIGSAGARSRLTQAFEQAGLATALANGLLTELTSDKAGKDSRAEQLRVEKEVERGLLADDSTA